MFEKNEGTLDRLLRATLGTVLLLSGLLWLTGLWQWIAIIIAVLLFFTALIGHCTPYALLKINTLKYGANWPVWVSYLWFAILAVGFILVYLFA